MGFPEKILDEIDPDTVEFLLSEHENGGKTGGDKKFITPPSNLLNNLLNPQNGLLPGIPSPINPIAVSPFQSGLQIANVESQLSVDLDVSQSLGSSLTKQNVIQPAQVVPHVFPSEKPMDYLAQMKGIKIQPEALPISQSESQVRSPICADMKRKTLGNIPFSTLDVEPLLLDKKQKLLEDAHFSTLDIGAISEKKANPIGDVQLPNIGGTEFSALLNPFDISPLFSPVDQESLCGSLNENMEEDVASPSELSPRTQMSIDNSIAEYQSGLDSFNITEEELRDITIPDLNRMKGIPKEALKELKLKRRVLKNRMYAQKCRDKRENNFKSSQFQIAELQKKLQQVAAERDYFKNKCLILITKSFGLSC